MQMHLESSILLLLLPGCGCGGAVTVAGDCCYGPCKSSVPVMKISKRIKEREKKNAPGTRDADASRALHSHPSFQLLSCSPAMCWWMSRSLEFG